MQSRTQSAHLSRHALTCHHGQLLRDSGFTKRDSLPNSLPSSVHISTPRLGESFYQSVRTGRWSSGKPAMSNIPKAGPSTSARQSLGIESTASIILAMQLAIDRMMALTPDPSPMFLPRTSYQRLRSALLAEGSDMPSWVQPLDRIPLPDFSSLERRLFSGSIPMTQGRQLGRQSLSSLYWWGLYPHLFKHPKTPSNIA